MAFPDVMVPGVVKTAGLNIVGEYLGYDWNQVWEEVRNEEFYGEDGGGISVTRDPSHKYTNSEVLNHIVKEIFENNPKLQRLTFLN